VVKRESVREINFGRKGECGRKERQRWRERDGRAGVHREEKKTIKNELS
jgi:hypothetical protein